MDKGCLKLYIVVGSLSFLLHWSLGGCEIDHDNDRIRYFRNPSLNSLAEEYLRSIPVNRIASEAVKVSLSNAGFPEPRQITSTSFKDHIDEILRVISDVRNSTCSECDECTKLDCPTICDRLYGCQSLNCPACPIPDWCPDPDDNGCPPRPNCPVCTNSNHNRSNVSNSSYIQESRKSPRERFIVHLNKTLDLDLTDLLGSIPTLAGGQGRALGKQLMTALHTAVRSKSFESTQLGRSFTYMTAKRITEAILRELFKRRARDICKCDRCNYLLPCQCPIEVECAEIEKCQACPTNLCPVPDDCPQHPACQECHFLKISEAYVDLDENPLNDADFREPVSPSELSRTVQCHGEMCQFKRTCGQAPLNPLTPRKASGYMVGGEDSVYGEWPSYVKLDIPRGLGEAMCGGVLISDRHVLTAGHCLHGIDFDTHRAPRLKITLGDYSRKQVDEHEIIAEMEDVCMSKRFEDANGTGSRYDFSVITLKKPVEFNDYVQPACLPYTVADLKDSHCYVIGLGVVKYDPSILAMHVFPDRLQKMQIRRVSCYPWGISDSDRSRHCYTKAYGTGDSCGGDSGGPILCLSKSKRWTVTGLVSYGLEACDGSGSVGWVGVYSRVPSLLKWVQGDCKL